ncbi:NAD(P)-dependent alcohol dehydrogenase [Saccharicrinis sp. GN24d3]|uniref:NAD(P)-dependent alcohol dehydrogenase n=1 Tax=Saccharicrinis sp. GN24d3 TaxID=3458416 RepID=UPI00403616DB
MMKSNNKMKAIVATGYGSPEVLKLRQVDKPVPKANEVLVKVLASSATAADGMMRTGKPFIARMFTGLRKPKHPIPGTGFAGIVETTGENVTTFHAGDKVFGETTLGFGTNAEYIAVPENGVILPLPETLRFTEATTVCDGHLTSVNFLMNIALVKPGQKVLINGASGSLGSAAVQLAKYYGAEVTGVCSKRNVGLVKSLGADFVIDYTKEDFTLKNKQYDIVYDTVGKLSYHKSKKALTKNGQFISPVLKFSLLLQMLWTSLYGSKKAKFGATGLRSAIELRQLLTELVEIFKEGKITTIIDRQFPLEKLEEAHKYIATGHKKGNVVIIHQLESQ